MSAHDRPAWEDAASAVQLSARDFARIQRFAYEQIGLNLHQGKLHLANARLAKEMRRLGIASTRDYFARLEQDASGEMISSLVDSLTTNFTSFYREAEHFRYFEKEILPKVQTWKECCIWCAASSTGEEPYSILASWLASANSSASRLKFIASDISTRVLAAARHGVYESGKFDDDALRRLKPMLLKGSRSADGYYRIRPEYRKMIDFRRINLMDEYPFGSEFLCIFCRNAMIYFDRPTQGRVVARLSRCLVPGGYLFVGHSESLGDLHEGLDYVRPALYRKHGTLGVAGVAGVAETHLQGGAGNGPHRSRSR